MHRYIPLIVKRKGFKNICEIEVNHREREHGVRSLVLSVLVMVFWIY